MRGMSGFVEQNIPAMIDYLDAVSTVPDDFTLQSNSTTDGSLVYSHLSGPDKHDRMLVVASIRARLDNNDEVPTLHKDAVPLLPHLLDVPKHLAIITSAIVRNAKSGAGAPPLRTMSSRGPSNSQDWDHGRFADLCFDVEAQALKSVATLASSAARAWKARSISSALQNALNVSTSSTNVVAPLPPRPSSAGLGARTRKISTESRFRGMHQHPVSIDAAALQQQGDTPPVSPTIAFVPMNATTRSVSDSISVEPIPPVPSLPIPNRVGSPTASFVPLSPPPPKQRKNARPSTAPGSTTAAQSLLFAAGVISRPNDYQYQQYRERTIATGGSTNDDAIFAYAYSPMSPTSTSSRRPTTSRESLYTTSSYRKPVPAYSVSPTATAPVTTVSSVTATATLRGQRPGDGDDRVGREKAKTKERTRSSFIKLPFSDEKKRSIGSRHKRPPSVAATAPMPAMVSSISGCDTVRGVHGTLRGAFTDTSNIHGQVPTYSPVMFDEKMYVGKDLSSGGSIGNIGSRRRAGSIGVADLYRARTHEESGVKKKRTGFFAWLRRA